MTDFFLIFREYNLENTKIFYIFIYSKNSQKHMKDYIYVSFLLCLAVACFFFRCTSDKDFKVGKRNLEQQGYTNVINTGQNTFCCSGNELFSTGFEDRDKNGEVASGCFCSNAFKGVTVRFE